MTSKAALPKNDVGAAFGRAFEAGLLTAKDASVFLAVSEKTLFNLTKAGAVPVVRLGARCIRYSYSDLQAFIERCKSGGR